MQEKEERGLWLELLRSMIKIRRVEERLLEVFAQGKVPGFIHVGIGQEAVPAGIGSILRPDDLILTTHRGHGHAIAKGLDLKRFMAEIFGRVDGYCKGRAGSMHMASAEWGVVGSNGVVGGGIPTALGTAFASQFQGTDQVTVCFFGDGATNEGTFHESMNLAALWKLPILFCCENNGWAEFTPLPIHTKLQRLSVRADSYGMPGITIDGNDVLKVREEAGRAIDRARRGEGPTLLECLTHRWFGHFAGDAQKYRDPREIEEVRKFDPILRFQKFLFGRKALTEGDIEKMEAQIRMEIDEAVAFAEKSPVPGKESIGQEVYV